MSSPTDKYCTHDIEIERALRLGAEPALTAD